LAIHQHNLTGPHAIYDRCRRIGNADDFSSLLSYFQPAVAWFGLVGCLAIVLVFGSASWWSGNITVRKVLVAYTAVSGFPSAPAMEQMLMPLDQPLLLSLAWISMKTFRQFSNAPRSKGWYVRLSDEWEPLSTVLAHLEWKIEEKIGANGRSESEETMPGMATQQSKGSASFFGWIIQRPTRALRRSRPISSLAEADNVEIREMAHS
ncbi:MAG: hypothetical protein L6R39_005526, partial [Caloplaca ligustica]